MTDAPLSPGVVEAARGLLTAVKYTAPPVDFGTPSDPNLCYECRIPVEFVTRLEASLSTVQPTAGGGGDREAIARIIDPEAWTFRPWNENWTLVMIERREKSLAKADAIIAVRPAPAEVWRLTREEVGLALYTAKYSDGSDPGDTSESLAEGWEWFKNLKATPDSRLGHAFLPDHAGLEREIDAIIALRPTPDEMAAEVGRAREVLAEWRPDLEAHRMALCHKLLDHDPEKEDVRDCREAEAALTLLADIISRAAQALSSEGPGP